MAIVQIDPEAEAYPTLTAGVHYGVINSIAVEPGKKDPSKFNLVWKVNVTDTGTGVTKQVTAWTPINKNSGSRAPTWLRQCGVADPSAGFDTDALAGMKVAVQIELEADNRPDRVGRMQERIGNITRV